MNQGRVTPPQIGLNLFVDNALNYATMQKADGFLWFYYEKNDKYHSDLLLIYSYSALISINPVCIPG
jgi:hypothetical protein